MRVTKATSDVNTSGVLSAVHHPQRCRLECSCLTSSGFGMTLPSPHVIDDHPKYKKDDSDLFHLCKYVMSKRGSQPTWHEEQPNPLGRLVKGDGWLKHTQDCCDQKVTV